MDLLSDEAGCGHEFVVSIQATSARYGKSRILAIEIRLIVGGVFFLYVKSGEMGPRTSRKKQPKKCISYQFSGL